MNTINTNYQECLKESNFTAAIKDITVIEHRFQEYHPGSD